MKKIKDNISLNKDDYKIINDFFKTLGNSGVTGTRKNFQLSFR